MTKQILLDCQKRIAPFVHNTSVLTSQAINELLSANVFFKCENFQKMGAFKMRGALNAIMQLSETQKAKGVVTHSSGNFAQAVSLAAKNLGVKAYIVMPSSAPKVKQEAVLGYGGIITICEPSLKAREETSDKIKKETGATFIHPSNDLDVIVGNSTACTELLNFQNDLDVVITPVGGGGLLSGSILATKYFSPNTKVIGAEPLGADDAFRSIRDNTIYPSVNPQTIADGLLTSLSNRTFNIIKDGVDRIITVKEDSIKKAMYLIWERMKIIIEPSSATVLAVIMENKELFKHKNIAMILSGGNISAILKSK